MHWRVLWSPALWTDGGGGGESGADVVALYNAWAAARVIRFRPSRGDEDPALPSSRSSPGGDGTHERDGEKITNALRTLGTFGTPGDPGDKKSAPGEETAPEEDECECAGCGDGDDDVGSCALFPRQSTLSVAPCVRAPPSSGFTATTQRSGSSTLR